MNKLNDNNISKLQQTIQKAKAELLVMQSYELAERGSEGQENYIDDDPEEEIGAEFVFDFTNMWELKVNNEVVLEMLGSRKPTNVIVAEVNDGKIFIQFTHLNADEKRVLSENNLMNKIEYRCLFSKKGNDANDKQNCREYILNETDDCFTFTPDILEAEATYEIKVKAVVCSKESEWSDEAAEFTTPEFKECCVWKKCPDNVFNEKKKYSVGENNPRIVTKPNDNYFATIIGNISLPSNKVTSWSIKILKSKNNNGSGIYIGVSLFDIVQNDDFNHFKCGWYFDCYDSTLYSGPPHNYKYKEYGLRKEKGVYVHEGDIVGVVMDTTKGELSFVLNGVNWGVAYKGIPLDKPLVPCVLLYNNGDSVELVASEVKENVDSSIHIPSNITTKSITWDSITLTWNVVEGTSFYQIEVDESISGDLSTTNTITKKEFLPKTEHSFRVRTVKSDSVGEWSDVVSGKTLMKIFETSFWKECPDYVDYKVKYVVDKLNPRIALKIGSDFCTVIGNIPISPKKVSSWNIKILKSQYNDGSGVYIGVAPSDINQNEVGNFRKCGWYFYCWNSILYSGPPHNYSWKQYGPRKEEGKYVHTGDSVGVVMDTTKGELSFTLSGINYDVAYEGIPLDKPLVPCVALYWQDDSVELSNIEVK